MAQRARLSPPRFEPEQAWPWHQVKWTSLPVNNFRSGDRRMEAENYLSGGYGLRLTIENRSVGWQSFADYANVWQPSRLKGIQVSPDFGTPFLAATQMFDIRPVPRKWLAIERTNDAANRFINAGTIVVTCSGAVGRATLAYAPHDRTLISHDLLRVEVRDHSQWGWVFAYLRSDQARSMMTSAQYGHIIKHLEPSHLNALPVPIVNDERAREFRSHTTEILALRNRAYHLTLEAEERFEAALGSFNVCDWGEGGFNVRAAEAFFTGRRRFEGIFHNPGAAVLRSFLAKHGQGFTRICDAGFDVWLPTRFRRIPAEDGVWLLDSSDLFECNPDLTKRIADSDFGDPYKGRVKTGWLLLARSGQTYGINGSLVLASEALENKVISDHVIRIAPQGNTQIRVGYIQTALSHPKLGRPLVKSLAYGSSIPEIDPTDFSRLEVVRLEKKEEDTIADLAEESASLRAQADAIERALGMAAGELIGRFISGDMESFITSPFINARPTHPAQLD